MKNATEWFGEKNIKGYKKKSLLNKNWISNPAFLLNALRLFIHLSYFIPISYKVIYNIWIQIFDSSIYFDNSLIASTSWVISQRLDSFLIKAGKIRIAALNLFPQYSTGACAPSHYFCFGCLSFVFCLTPSDPLHCRNALHLWHTKKLLWYNLLHDNLTVIVINTTTYDKP